jgi:DNA polymerase-3 subunit delta
MEHDSIIKDLKSGKAASLYLIAGDEPYYIDLVSKSIEEDLLEEGMRDFNLSILYGRDTDPEKIVSLARAFPMMGDRQVIVVREAQDMDATKRGSKMDYLASYAENPQPSTVLALVFKNKAPDKRLTWVKNFSKKGILFESKALRDDQVPSWIEKWLKDKGYSVSPEASRLIAEHLGNKLSNIVNELSKLSIILPPGSKIDPGIVERHIGISKEYNQFELQRALAKKDILKSNKIIAYFASNPKEHPIQASISALYNYFTKIGLVHTTEPGKLAETLKINPYFVKEYKDAATQYPLAKVVRIIGYLRDTDRKIKGVGNKSIEDEFLMKELVYKILH